MRDFSEARRVRPSVEGFEARLLLSTYDVTTTTDNGEGSLRQAIVSVNQDATPDTIDFRIGGGGPQTITLLSGLPTITNQVTIDGTSQPGYNGTPLVVIDGKNSTGVPSADLTIQANDSIVQGLAIVNSTSSGIFLDGVTGVLILANDIGVIPGVGTQAPQVAPNATAGIALSFASNNIIGQAGAGNLIGGNLTSGIAVGLFSTANLIQGNSIGTAPSTGLGSGLGLSSMNLGNGGDGINLNLASMTTIGGTVTGAGNLIAGNVQNGVSINGGSGNDLVGNFIGVLLDGQTTRPNGQDGIFLGNSADNTIGGPTPQSGNVVSGNSANGVDLTQSASTGNLIEGNKIGVDPTGSGFVSNSGNGVRINNAPGNVILDNVISSNNFAGVFLSGSGASANAIRGNLIGTDLAGDQLSNVTDGIFLIQAPNNTIGGTTPDDRNVISSNSGNGVSLRGPLASGNLVEGNYIGVGPSGTTNQGNVSDGVFIQNSPGNTIGGTAPGSANVISHNRIGVDIETFPNSQLGQVGTEFSGGQSDGNVVQGNLIGTDVTGLQSLGNSAEGLLIVGGSNNLIGGTAPGAGNLISANLSNGIGIEVTPSVPDPTSGNLIEGNRIGLAADGRTALGNRANGIFLNGAPGTTIGGTASGAGNVISGNAVNGIIDNGSSGSSAILGNFIGVSANGLVRLANGQNGVDVEAGTAIVIGSSLGFGRNVISGNGSSGVRLASGTSSAQVEANFLGVSSDGLTSTPNDQSGVFVAQGSAANTIGGSTPGAGNVISGNATGVMITDPGTSHNQVIGNTIGLSFGGESDVGNLGYGVVLINGATANVIGGTSSLARNVISDNGQGVGIIGPGSTGNLLEGNFIGLDATGELPQGNLQIGLFLNGAADNTVGGTTAGSGNVISGNAGAGVEVFGPSSVGNLIVGNIIGLDATGSHQVTTTGESLGDVNFGIQVNNAPGTTIGGTTLGSRNVISGNLQNGIDITGQGAIGTVIQGNLIGLDITGTIALGNMANGIQVANAPMALIGGASVSSRNVISGNANSGVEIDGALATSVAIEGNFVGTDASGTEPLGNAQSGVLVNAAPAVTIGGSTLGTANVISGNLADGVRITGLGSVGTLILGNDLGVDPTGRLAVGNGNDGVFLDGSTGATVGGTTSGAGNVISGNTASGVEFGGSNASNNVVEGNKIGTDIDGVASLGNFTGLYLNNAPSNVVGGLTRASGNLISGNAGSGVLILGLNARNNQVTGNLIGTNFSGLDQLGNVAGVFIDGSPANRIAGNLISGNSSAGVVIATRASTANLVVGNTIGPDISGTRVVLSVSPQQSGVLIDDAPGNLVGGSTATDRNVISGNLAGVVIAGFNAQNNLVQGNNIGTNAAGTGAIPNVTGVYVNGSSANTIGGTTFGQGNVISGNTSTGITIYGTLATANLVEGNLIGTNASGLGAIPNQSGVYIELASSNTIGGATPDASNLISGNSVAGVYIFDGAQRNLIRRNKIGVSAAGKKLGNGEYGVLLFNASNNTVDKSKATGNTIANSGIGDFREFTGSVSTTTTSKSKSKPKTKPKTKVTARLATPTGPKVVTVSHRGSAARSASNHQTGR